MEIDKRKPTPDELRLIEYLAHKANYELSPDYREHIYVVPIPPVYEGEFTPLEIRFDNAPDDMKMNGKPISDCLFYDSDNVLVTVYLLANDLGYLVELDFWKVDYSPILRIPPSECFMEMKAYTPENDGKDESSHSSVLQKIKQFVKGIIG